MMTMREMMRLVEALHGEIIPPRKNMFGAGEFTTDDPKHDRSWEAEPDAAVMPIWEFGEKVSHEEFVAFVKRNANRLTTTSHSRGPDSIGVSDTSQWWRDEKGIDRALYTSGYHDTEYWIDPQWGKGIEGSVLEPEPPLMIK